MCHDRPHVLLRNGLRAMTKSPSLASKPSTSKSDFAFMEPLGIMDGMEAPTPIPQDPKGPLPMSWCRLRKGNLHWFPVHVVTGQSSFDATIRQVVLMLLNSVQILVCRTMMLLCCGRQTGRQVLNFENSTQSGSPILIYGYFDIL